METNKKTLLKVPIVDLQKKYDGRAFNMQINNTGDQPVRVRLFGNGQTFAEIVDLDEEGGGTLQEYVRQFNTMPALNPWPEDLPIPAMNRQIIVQYTGRSSENYKTGYFYRAIIDEMSPQNNRWERIDVQEAGTTEPINITQADFDAAYTAGTLADGTYKIAAYTPANLIGRIDVGWSQFDQPLTFITNEYEGTAADITVSVVSGKVQDDCVITMLSVPYKGKVSYYDGSDLQVNDIIEERSRTAGYGTLLSAYASKGFYVYNMVVGSNILYSPDWKLVYGSTAITSNWTLENNKFETDGHIENYSQITLNYTINNPAIEISFKNNVCFKSDLYLNLGLEDFPAEWQGVNHFNFNNNKFDCFNLGSQMFFFGYADINNNVICRGVELNNLYDYNFSGEFTYNQIGVNANEIRIGGNFNCNVIGDFCSRLTFNGSASYNTFGARCDNIRMGDGAYGNAFGYYCRNVWTGADFKNNTIGNDYVAEVASDSEGTPFWQIGNNVVNCHIGSGCNSISFGDNCGACSIGDNSSYIKMGSTTFSVHIGADCQHVEQKSTSSYWLNCTVADHARGLNVSNLNYVDFSENATGSWANITYGNIGGDSHDVTFVGTTSLPIENLVVSSKVANLNIEASSYADGSVLQNIRILPGDYMDNTLSTPAPKTITIAVNKAAVVTVGYDSNDLLAQKYLMD